jgi:AcrR family transcriptional regulator
MYAKIRDSRQRYTKQCVFTAFHELLEEKRVSEITVMELCERAGVSRKTFYKYYADPFALLTAMQDDLFSGFMLALRDQPHDIAQIVPQLIRFADEHRVLLKAVYENRSEGNFIDKVMGYLYEVYSEDWQKANPKMTREDVDYLFHFVTSGLVGIIRYWLVEVPDASVEAVSAKSEWLMGLATPRG